MGDELVSWEFVENVSSLKNTEFEEKLKNEMTEFKKADSETLTYEMGKNYLTTEVLALVSQTINQTIRTRKDLEQYHKDLEDLQNDLKEVNEKIQLQYNILADLDPNNEKDQPKILACLKTIRTLSAKRKSLETQIKSLKQLINSKAKFELNVRKKVNNTRTKVNRLNKEIAKITMAKMNIKPSALTTAFFNAYKPQFEAEKKVKSEKSE